MKAHAEPSTDASPARKPTDDEIDVYGLTHPGKVREVNQDNFLLAPLRKRMERHRTTLPEATQVEMEETPSALLALLERPVAGGCQARPRAPLRLHRPC